MIDDGQLMRPYFLGFAGSLMSGKSEPNIYQTYSPCTAGWLHGDDLPWDRIRKTSPNKDKSKIHGILVR